MEGDEDLHRIPVIVVSTDSTTHRVQMMLGYGARGTYRSLFIPRRCDPKWIVFLKSYARRLTPDTAAPPERRMTMRSAVENIDELMPACLTEVLETMFFAEMARLDGPAPPSWRKAGEVRCSTSWANHPARFRFR